MATYNSFLSKDNKRIRSYSNFKKRTVRKSERERGLLLMYKLDYGVQLS